MINAPKLNRGAERLLYEGDALAQRWKLAAALVGKLRHAGWSQDQILEAFGQAHDAQGRPYVGVQQVRSKYRSGTERKVIRLLDGALPLQEERWRARIARERIRVLHQWPYGGSYDSAFRVYISLLELAERVGRADLTVSTRQVAELAGVGGFHALHGSNTKPVRRSLAQLHDARLISYTPGQRANDASGVVVLTRLQGVESEDLTSPRSPDGLVGRSLSSSLLHPCWERQRGDLVLGISGCRIWHLLLLANGPQAVSTLVRASRYSAPTVRGALKRLQCVGLAEPDASTWRATRQDLDEVSEWIGTERRPMLRASGNREARLRRREGQSQWARLQRNSGAPVGIDPETGELLEDCGPFDDAGSAHDVLTWKRGPLLKLTVFQYERLVAGRREPQGELRPENVSAAECAA